jgi:ATP-dependent Lhr-like helicase
MRSILAEACVKIEDPPSTKGPECRSRFSSARLPLVHRLRRYADERAASAAGRRSRRQHTLIAAPTGSGKTLAAFLTAIDDLVQEASGGPLPDEVRVVYVSPLKALSADIHKNLAEPRRGIRQLAKRGLERAADHRRGAHRRHDAVRARGDAAHAAAHPGHDAESLYLLLTADAAADAATVRTVIVDEIHAVIGTRRGAHLALSLERLQHVADARTAHRLSATQKPVEEVARFSSDRSRRGGCAIVDEGIGARSISRSRFPAHRSTR